MDREFDMRKRSVKILKSLRIPDFTTNVPLAPVEALRTRHEVAQRLLALNVCGALGHGCPNALATKWIESEGGWNWFSREERAFLKRGVAPLDFTYCVHAAWAIAWMLELVDEFRPGKLPPQTLIRAMPDIEKAGSSKSFLSAPKLAERLEIYQKLDEVRCLHESLRHWRTTPGHPGDITRRLITAKYQRLPFEWICSGIEWDDLSVAIT